MMSSNKNINLTREESQRIKNLSSALSKMPPYTGNLKRSLYFVSNKSVDDFLNTHSVGKTIRYREFLSISKRGTYNPDGQVQIYRKCD